MDATRDREQQRKRLEKNGFGEVSEAGTDWRQASIRAEGSITGQPVMRMYLKSSRVGSLMLDLGVEERITTIQGGAGTGAKVTCRPQPKTSQGCME